MLLLESPPAFRSRNLFVSDNTQALAQSLSISPVADWPGGRADGGGATAMALSDGYAFVASDSMLVLDIHEPATPMEEATYDDGGRFDDVAMVDQYALLTRLASAGLPGASAIGGLRVIDISNPASPRFVAAYETAHNARGLAVSDGRAYRVESVVGSYGADLSFDESWLISWDVAVSGDYLYAAEANWVLRVLQMSTVPETVPLSAEFGVGALLLKWPATTTELLLESSADPTGTTWDPVPGIRQLNGDKYELTVPADAPARFFRLRKP